MKKIYVGCRVRITGCYDGSQARRFIGCSARVTADGSNIMGEHLWGVDIDDGSWGFASEHLEPIQDPGHQVISWEEMADLWTPEKVGA